MLKKTCLYVPKLFALFMLNVLIVAGCSDDSSSPPPSFEVVQSETSHNSSSTADLTDLDQLINDNTTFALDFYNQLKAIDTGNFFYSPYSISIALAMVWAGASGDTESQMSETLHFSFSQDSLHSLFNSLDLRLKNLGSDNPDEFKLNIVNATWLQTGYNFEKDFLDTCAESYGAGLYLLDFHSRPDESRIVINNWVEEQTENKIKNLLPEGSITPSTRLVLTNAIYFKADWRYQFYKEDTTKGDFYLLSGEKITVDMMRRKDSVFFCIGSNYQAIELPYKGDQVSMVIIMPDIGEFESFEANINTTKLNTIIELLEDKYIDLTMPKFSFDYDIGLVPILKKLGMIDAFDPYIADFSGITVQKDFYISDIFHKAFVAVDEKGTEAAAATAAIHRVSSIPPTFIPVAIERPFIFIIRDKETNAILFIGRVMNPAQF